MPRQLEAKFEIVGVFGSSACEERATLQKHIGNDKQQTEAAAALPRISDSSDNSKEKKERKKIPKIKLNLVATTGANRDSDRPTLQRKGTLS